MNAPLYKYGAFGDEMSLIVALVIGIGFGFFLERAGFGSALKLTAQFYLTDLAVFKVMFTAILTAMVGLFYLSWFGVLDLSLVYVSPTRLPSQILGGLLLGFGFVIGGYCPGTSVVAVATGRLDAIVFLVGVSAGIFGFGEVSPMITDFLLAGDLGKVTLADYFNLRYGIWIFAIVLLALAGFYAAEAVERLMARRTMRGE